jgi:hypothetical protein
MNATRYRCQADGHAVHATTADEKRTPRRKEQADSGSHLSAFASLRETGTGVFRTAKLGLCLLAALVALAASRGSGHAQSGGGYTLTWWTADVGGAVVTGGTATLHGTVGQTESGTLLTGGGFTLAGGFWPGGPAAPLAVVDLRGAKSGGFLRLDWTAVNQDIEGNSITGVTYNIYRAQDLPYFPPGPAYATGVATNSYTDPDGNVIGNTAHPTYYLIRAVQSGLTGENSYRIGCFAFSLTPGSP